MLPGKGTVKRSSHGGSLQFEMSVFISEGTKAGPISGWGQFVRLPAVSVSRKRSKKRRKSE